MEETRCDVGESTDAHQFNQNNTHLSKDNIRTSKNNFPFKSKPLNSFRSRTCSYFYNTGYCKFGNNCKYRHYKKGNDKYTATRNSLRNPKQIFKNENVENKISLQNINLQTSSQADGQRSDFMEDNHESHNSVDLCTEELYNLNLSPSLQKIPSKIYPASHRSSKARNKTVCYFFKRGVCNKGDSCKFYHHNRNTSSTPVAEVPDLCTENKDSLLMSSEENKNGNLVANKPTNLKNTLNVHDLSSLTSESINQLRSTEINQLKKRFPHFESVIENLTFSIIFQSSDPDWAFDVRNLKLEVEFPEKYPTEKCKITVIQDAENIPPLLIKYLNKVIYEWIDEKFKENNASNKTELVFRTFLKWFDKNLESLFIAGLKKVKQDLKAKEDGIEFVPVENLFPLSTNNAEEAFEESSATKNEPELPVEAPVADVKNSQISTNESNKLPYIGGNNGMKIVFGGLELTEGAAAFICTKISVTLQCSRCKTPLNTKSIPKKNNSLICSKCSKNVGFTFDPATVHQFSSVLGTLHLLDCVAVDINLVECHFLVDCLNCSKQVSVDGIHYGQKHKMWCLFCNEKMLISIGSVKFQALKLTSFSETKYTPAKKTERKVKDPVVKEGEPLPNFGACRHYKKSFRWLRFPCCGRLYPCDECHNENETDHEMKYASRMICGFCAKEQPYSREKPCVLCSQNMTKKSGSHWEGGKGCRNKIAMSREDKQKYSGVCKTVSKKAQNAKPKKKH